MGSAAVEIKLREIDRLAEKLNSFALSGGDKKRLLQALGVVIEEQTKERFDIARDPRGDPWRALTEAYRKRKLRGTGRKGKKKRKGSTGGILVREGFLRMSIEHQLMSGDSVLIGSPMEYADYHQSAKDIKRRREFLGLSFDNIAELQSSINEFMEARLT